MSQGGLFPPREELAGGRAWLAESIDGADADGVVLGLSGGLDSATVALWAAPRGSFDPPLLTSVPR